MMLHFVSFANFTKDNAAILRWGGEVGGEDIGGAGANVADESGGLVAGVAPERLCLKPKTNPSTTAIMTINPTAPPISTHFFLDDR